MDAYSTRPRRGESASGGKHGPPTVCVLVTDYEHVNHKELAQLYATAAASGAAEGARRVVVFVFRGWRLDDGDDDGRGRGGGRVEG
eukprot:2771257-Pleurochrysis_carterae.AAC.1